MDIKVKYIPEHPCKPTCPQVFIDDISTNEYLVEFWDNPKNKIISSQKVKGGQIAYGNRQWYTEWKILVKHKGKVIFKDEFFIKPSSSVGVYINIDSYALGDHIAWMPYVEEFRKKHGCTVIFSSFWNRLFERQYPNLAFVHPTQNFDKVYAQYNVGIQRPYNRAYCPTQYGQQPLQKTAADILGLEFKEIAPKIDIPQNISTESNNIVCISEFASGDYKRWKGDWQAIVDFLNNNGYIVKAISLEKTNLKNVIDKTGNLPIEDRICDLKNAQFFIGASTGLSWLSWAIGTHVFLISDFTPPQHEFISNCTRIYSDKCNKIINDIPFEWGITEKQIIKNLSMHMEKNKQLAL